MRVMSRPAIWFRKWAILCHRWMGVVFCLLFAMWFVSGIVLMYWDYPGVGMRDRLERAPALDASRIRLTPAQALARLGTAQSPGLVRLSMLDGRPAYRFYFGRLPSTVFADNGEAPEEFPLEVARRVATAWTGLPPETARFEGSLTEEDQWTVSGEFRELRPLLKYSWPDGSEVYVSQVTGEVVQSTTRGSRTGAYFGAIPHWLYFTPLRKKGAAWNNVVVWSSGVGTVMTIFGLVVGITLYSPSRKRYRFPHGRSSIPYAGQKRWHTMLGLLFGLVTCTWVFSGMLSMEPFEWQTAGSGIRLAGTLRGGPVDSGRFAAKPPQAALAEAAADLRVKELELTSFAGEPVYLARESPERSRIVPIEGTPVGQFDSARVTSVLAKAAKPYRLAEVRVVNQYEPYYVDRHHNRPLPVLFVRLDDAESSMFYVDLKTGRLAQSYSSGLRWSRWLYHGLHSFDLPWLYRHRPAWDIFVLVLMLGGTTLCVTSLVIGWRRLRRKLASAL
ncbi:MAG: hypothetical protein C5B51_31605 [Terriglobia bacterium]|nr:MAG: hypothetical protein C5B51_31605 [Terriglobia bacterium]